MGNAKQKFEYQTGGSGIKWRPVVEEAASKIANVYSASFFARRFISIPDQQVRAFNLSFALAKTNKVIKQSRVAIIGGGISGMTCAVALAMLKGCQVLVFERDTQLMRRFREAPFRFIHPDMNASTDSDSADFHLRKKTSFAFMNWSANRAPAVAAELCKKFDHYRASSAISLHLAETVKNIKASDNGLIIEFEEHGPITVDVVILATGFGDEKVSEATNDASYWHSGNPKQYKATAMRPGMGPPSKLEGGVLPKERIVISGNGDSGLIELAHFLIKDFRHEMVAQMLPSNGMAPSLGLDFAQRVADLWFRKIEFYEDDDTGLQGPLAWYWSTRELALASPRRLDDIAQSQYAANIFRIYNVFDKELEFTEKTTPIISDVLHDLEWEVEPLLDDLASYEINDLMGTYVAEALPIPKEGFFREDFDVALIGPTVREYSRRQAPQNWFVLFYLKHYGKFEYIFHRLENKDIQRGQVAYRGLGADGPEDRTFAFDRLIVRQGPDFKSLGYETALESRENSQFRLTHLRNLEYELNPSVRRYHDQFITAFRTSRWQESAAAHIEFIDHREGEEPFDSVEHIERKLDDCLLDLMRLGRDEDACKLYRGAKATTDRRKRLHALEQLLEIQMAETKRKHPNRTKTTKKRRRAQ